MTDQPSIVDLFAGPGGWDHALHTLGRTDVLGVEYDDHACATRIAAGLWTLQANVAELDPLDYAGIDGLIASPPCQAWSMAGNRKGEHDRELVAEVVDAIVAGKDPRADAREIRWRLTWPIRELAYRRRRRRGELKLDRATVAHVWNVPPWLLDEPRSSGDLGIIPAEARRHPTRRPRRRPED